MYYFFVFFILWSGSVICGTINSGNGTNAVYHIQLPLQSLKNSDLKPVTKDNVNNKNKYYFQTIPLNNSTKLGVRLFQIKNQTNSTKPITIKRITVTNSATLKPVQTVIARTIRMSRKNKPS